MNEEYKFRYFISASGEWSTPLKFAIANVESFYFFKSDGSISTQFSNSYSYRNVYSALSDLNNFKEVSEQIALEKINERFRAGAKAIIAAYEGVYMDKFGPVEISSTEERMGLNFLNKKKAFNPDQATGAPDTIRKILDKFTRNGKAKVVNQNGNEKYYLICERVQ